MCIDSKIPMLQCGQCFNDSSILRRHRLAKHPGCDPNYHSLRRRTGAGSHGVFKRHRPPAEPSAIPGGVLGNTQVSGRSVARVKPARCVRARLHQASASTQSLRCNDSWVRALTEIWKQIELLKKGVATILERLHCFQ